MLDDETLSQRKLHHELRFLEIELRELYLLLLKKNRALKSNDSKEIQNLKIDERVIRENIRLRLSKSLCGVLELIYYNFQSKKNDIGFSVSDLLHLFNHPLLKDISFKEIKEPIQLFKERIDILENWNASLSQEKKL